MKKLLSLALALIMVLTLSVAVAAQEHTDMETVTISVTYNATNSGTVSPAETFVFTIAKTSVTDAADGVTTGNMPVPAVRNVEFAEGDAGNAGSMTKNVTITLPEYTSVGVYTYTITPTPRTTGGVTYWGRPIKLVVTVIEQNGKIRVAAVHTEGEGEEKTDDITYTYSAGSLSVTKSVTGNLGDRAKEFNVWVTFTAPEAGVVNSTISYIVDGETKTIAPAEWEENTASVQIALHHEETVTFTNIPYGVTYHVAEDSYEAEDYKTSYNKQDGTIGAASDAVTITNTKGTTVDTGIALDSLPYVLLIAVAVVGVVAFTAKKRTTDR